MRWLLPLFSVLGLFTVIKSMGPTEEPQQTITDMFGAVITADPDFVPDYVQLQRAIQQSDVVFVKRRYILLSKMNDAERCLAQGKQFNHLWYKLGAPDPYAVVGGQSLVDLAYQIASKDPGNNNAAIIKAILIDNMLMGVNVFKKFSRTNRKKTDDFIQRMQVYINPWYVIKGLIAEWATIDSESDRVAELIDYKPTVGGETISPPRDLFKENNSLIFNLIQHHAHDHKRLQKWIQWCLEHGAPVDGTESINKTETPLMVAVRGKGHGTEQSYLAVIKILRQYGADPSKMSGGESPRSLIEQKYAQDANAINQEIRELLSTEHRANAAPKITARPASVTVAMSKLLYSYKTWMLMGCLYLGFKCYRHIARGYTAQYEKNTIINGSGSALKAIDEDGHSIIIPADENNNTAVLPKFTGLLTVIFQDTSKNTSQSLVIDLDRYADDDYDMNITIRPTKWFERIFVRSPLYYSVSWKYGAQ